MPGGTPQRITNEKDAAYATAGFEFEPSFSADGKTLIYTTWNDENAGAIYKVNLQGKAQPVLPLLLTT